MARTYFINPSKDQEKNYAFLVELQDYALQLLKPGAKCSQIYTSTVEYIEKHRPDLKPKFMKNMGWSIGVEFREYLILSARCAHTIRSGTIFALVLGFHNIKPPNTSENDPTGQYSLLLADTVVVNKDSPATFLTKLNKAPEVIAYVFDEKVDRFKQDGEYGEELNGKSDDPARSLRSGRKKRKTIYVKESLKDRDENQKRLHKSLQENGYNRFKDSKGVTQDNEGEALKRFESYKKEFQLPDKIKDVPIVIDKRSETVVFSINGQPVPFHMFIIKSASVTDEQNHSYLRVNFILPSKGKKEQIPVCYSFAVPRCSSYVADYLFLPAHSNHFNPNSYYYPKQASSICGSRVCKIAHYKE